MKLPSLNKHWQIHLLNRTNDFKFDQIGTKPQLNCPFAAHIRKTNPRNDIGNPDPFRIMRRGIPFGPALKESELTEDGRGLLFACYQTSIKNGFKFHQQCEFLSLIIVSLSWWERISLGEQWSIPSCHQAPNPRVRDKKTDPRFIWSITILDSLDPIIGQGPNRSMSGLDPLDDTLIYTFEDFVIPKGGEYFFSPSITALAEYIGKA